jgi:hypothetical protein
MSMIGSEFDVDYFEYNSKLTGYTFKRFLWEKEFKLFVNNDNSLKFEIGGLKLEATCEAY